MKTYRIYKLIHQKNGEVTREFVKEITCVSLYVDGVNYVADEV